MKKLIIVIILLCSNLIYADNCRIEEIIHEYEKLKTEWISPVDFIELEGDSVEVGRFIKHLIDVIAKFTDIKDKQILMKKEVEAFIELMQIDKKLVNQAIYNSYNSIFYTSIFNECMKLKKEIKEHVEKTYEINTKGDIK
jgi:hypothetical protein